MDLKRPKIGNYFEMAAKIFLRIDIGINVTLIVLGNHGDEKFE